MNDSDRAAVDLALSTTRSVRRRIDFARAVPAELLEDAIDVAVQAPTGANAEAWRFLVLTEPEPKRALAELYRRALARYREMRRDAAAKPALNDLAERLHEIPALILVCSEGVPDPASRAQQVAFYASVLPAAWSLMVALRARGLGATWTTLHLLHEAEAAAALGIPDGVTQTVLLPIGYTRGAVLRPAARKAAREVTYWNEWGRTRG
jgi:nitroreductase